MKFALIGLSETILKKNIISLIKSNSNWILEAVCDKNALKLLEFSKIKHYSTIDDLLKECSIDVAIVGVSYKERYDVIKRLLESKINILTTDLFGLNSNEAYMLNNLARENLVKWSCLSSIFFSDYVNQCKDALKHIGNSNTIRARKLLALNSDENNEWSNQKALGNIGFSILDFLVLFFGQPNTIESNLIYKNSDEIEDSAYMMLKWLKNDKLISGFMEISKESFIKEDCIEISGSEGYLIINESETIVYNKSKEMIAQVINNSTEFQSLHKFIQEFLNWTSSDEMFNEKFTQIFKHNLNLNNIINEAYDNSKISVKKKYDYDWPRVTKSLEKQITNDMRLSLSIKVDRTEHRNEFERNFKEYHGAKDFYSLLFNSGTMAIFTMYRAIELMPNDLVVVPVYTFHATVSPMMHYGAIPVFCDCDSNGNMDPSKLRIICSRLPRKPKAVIVTHMWGVPANMIEISKICKELNIFLLEDCSHAHGASINGQMVGTFGDAAAWSLQCQKILSAGEGGIMLTRHKEMYYRGLLSSHFNKPCAREIDKNFHLYKYYITGSGLKLRMHPLAVTIANNQIKQLKSFIDTKSYFSKKLIAGLSDIPFLRMPKTESYEYSYSPSWYAFVMHFVKDKAPENLTRELFCEKLRKAGLSEIEMPNATILLNEEPLYLEPQFILPHVYCGEKALDYKAQFNEYNLDDYDNSRLFYSTAIKLPVWAHLDEEETVDRYINTINKVAFDL